MVEDAEGESAVVVMAKLAEPRCSVGCLGLGLDVFECVGGGERSLATLGYPRDFGVDYLCSRSNY